MRQFSLGTIYALPSGANPTPIPFGLLKSASADIDQAKVPVRGPMKAPVDVGDGELNIAIKFAYGEFRASAFALLASGSTTVVGSKLAAVSERQTIPTTPFQITVAQSATFSEDGGVLDVTGGKWLTRVAAGPTTGQYSVAAGVYTFAAADVGHVVEITYAYTSATVGQTTTFSNQPMGASTGYLVRLYNVFAVAGVLKPTGYEFPNVHFSKLSLALKTGDWAEVNMEGLAAQDSTGIVYKGYAGD
jgi:hypothetical protein